MFLILLYMFNVVEQINISAGNHVGIESLGHDTVPAFAVGSGGDTGLYALGEVGRVGISCKIACGEVVDNVALASMVESHGIGSGSQALDKGARQGLVMRR